MIGSGFMGRTNAATLSRYPHRARLIAIAGGTRAPAAGKYILLDKPVAASVAGCDRILEAARTARVKLMILYGQRFRTCNIEAHVRFHESILPEVSRELPDAAAEIRKQMGHA